MSVQGRHDLALSVVFTSFNDRQTPSFNDRQIAFWLNSTLGCTGGDASTSSTPVVVCEKYTGKRNEFYVKVRERMSYNRLLDRDGTNVNIGDQRVRFFIEPFTNRRRITEDGIKGSPLKRRRTVTSRSPRTMDTSMSNGNGNGKTSKQVFLHTKPSSHTPGSFLKYMNETLNNINMSDQGNNSIVSCYEVPNSFRDWVLQMKTEQDVDNIMNISGKHVVEGTRLHFKRHPNHAGATRHPIGTSGRFKNITSNKEKKSAQHQNYPKISGGVAHAKHLNNNTNTASVMATVDQGNAINEKDNVIAKLEEENQKLKKNMIKILKSNKAVKREDNFGSSLKQPIELDISDDDGANGKEEYVTLQKKLEQMNEKSKENAKELVSAKSAFHELRRETDAVKIDLVNAETGRDDIHKSWQEQHQEINQHKIVIERLKLEKIQDKDEYCLVLKDKDKQYQMLTTALANATGMLKEEREARRELLNAFGKEKDTHKKTRKQLKNFLTKVKSENNFDA